MVFCSFNHVKRGGYKLAQTFARRAILAADTDIWLEDVPLDLDDVFQYDLQQ